MNIVDGRAIALEIKNEVALQVEGLGLSPTLAIVACDPNFETVTYLELKERIATSLGIALSKNILPKSASTKEMIEAVLAAASSNDGVLVQLPLPHHIDTAAVLKAIPKTKDVDAFSYQGEATEVLPPVIGAIDAIAKLHQVDFAGKQVVILGQGRLVGGPALLYAKSKGALVTICDKETKDVESLTINADIIILGVGKANLLTASMVKPGVVVFDAGASEEGGVLVGDADPEVTDKAALITPVPGGIGPLTIAILFRNLLKLQTRQ